MFKDGSLVLLTEAIHGDADFVNGRYSFLCGSPCSLQVFYEGSWSKEYGLGVDTNKYYDIDCPVDKITEVTEYGNFDEQGFRIDSANVKVIDLYEIAKEFLETDTLK